ncbi:hypothetical protein EMCRGX_G028527 [Ephydatia muelleri]
MSKVPTIQVSVATSELLSDDLQRLLKETNELRRIADRIACSCNDPNCPFKPQPPVSYLDRSQSLPMGVGGSCDCEYVSDDEGPLQTCRFMRTQPARRGSSPGRRRIVPRTRTGSLTSRTLIVPGPNFHREYHSVLVLSPSS